MQAVGLSTALLLRVIYFFLKTPLINLNSFLNTEPTLPAPFAIATPRSAKFFF
jgi:hypothetical protein